MNKKIKQRKFFFKKSKAKARKNRNKINSGLYIPRQIQFKATRPDGCSKKKNLQPFFKVQDTLVELT